MKIVNVVRVYSTHGRPGGMIHVATDRSEALARAGHEVYVLTTSGGPKPSPVATSYSGIYGVDVNGVKVFHHAAGAPQEYSDQFAEMCVRLCDLLKPDVIHLESWDKHRLWWVPFTRVCRVAVTNHGEAVGSQLTEWRMRLHGRNSKALLNLFKTEEWLIERDQLSKADVVLATCRFDRWLLSDLVGLGGKVRLVYNPLPPCMFGGYPKGEGIVRSARRRFAAVGLYGHKERGFDVAKSACDLAAADLITPKCSRQELRDVYDGCNALLMPGFWSQGYDLCAAEAIARQRPVVISDAGIGTMESEGRPWIRTFPVGDAAALADILRGPLPAVPPDAADAHRPENHVRAWLAALGY